MPDSINPAVRPCCGASRRADIRRISTLAEHAGFHKSQRPPALLGLVSIGQSVNYRPRRTCLILSTPVFPVSLGHVLLDLVSIGQSMNCHPRGTRLVLSIPLFPVSMDLVSIGQSLNYHPRRPCLILSTALCPASLPLLGRALGFSTGTQYCAWYMVGYIAISYLTWCMARFRSSVK